MDVLFAFIHVIYLHIWYVSRQCSYESFVLFLFIGRWKDVSFMRYGGWHIPQIAFLRIILWLDCGHLLSLQLGNKCHDRKGLSLFVVSSITLRQELVEWLKVWKPLNKFTIQERKKCLGDRENGFVFLMKNFEVEGRILKWFKAELENNFMQWWKCSVSVL